MNILPAWFFTQCIQLPEEEATVALSVMRRLVPGIYGSDMIHHALGELVRLEPMSRIYSLPRVLALLGADGIEAADWSLLVEEYFPFFSPGEEQSNKEDPLLELFQELSTGQSTGALAKRARRSIALVPTNIYGDPDATGGDTHPYSNIAENRTPTAILAVLNHLAERDAASLNSVLQAEEEEQDPDLPPLNGFIDAGWQDRFGRLGRLLALGLKARLGLGGEREELVKRFLDESQGTPLLEPDVMAALAEALYPDQREEDESDTDDNPLETIRQEFILLRLYQEWASRSQRSARKRRALILSFLDLKDTPRVRTALSLLLWHGALHNRMAVLEPVAAADWLEPAWRPRFGSQPEVVIEIPGNRAGNTGALKDLLDSLPTHQGKDAPGIRVMKGEKPRWTADCRWPVLTPWLVFKAGQNRQYAYRDYRNRLALIRLIVAVETAGHILSGCLQQRSPARSDCPNITALMLHAIDLLWKLPDRRPPDDSNDSQPDHFSPSTYVLLTEADQWVLDYGIPRAAGIAPEFFYDLCAAWHKERDTPEAEIRQRLADYAFPETLVYLVQERIRESGSRPGASPQPWAEIWEQARTSFQWMLNDHKDYRSRNIYLLLDRFLGQQVIGERLAREFRDQVINKVLDPEGPKFYTRQFLVGFADNVPEDWHQGKAAEIEDALARINHPQGNLAVRAERVRMLCRHPEEDSGEEEAWLDRLADTLVTIDHRRHADLFIRLLLTGLLDQEKVIVKPYLWLSIFHFLLQYGHSFELQRLTNLLTGNSQASGTKASNLLGNQVLLQGMVQAIDRYRRDRENADEQRSAKDPNLVLLDRKKDQQLHRILMRCLLADWEQGSGEVAKTFAKEVWDQRHRQARDETRLKTYQIRKRFRNRRQHSELVGQHNPPLWRVRGAIVNPNDHQALLEILPELEKEILDPFSLPETTLEEIRRELRTPPAKDQRYLSAENEVRLVTSVLSVGREISDRHGHDPRMEVWLNTGLGAFVPRLPLDKPNRDTPWKIGDFLALTLTWGPDRSGERGTWQRPQGPRLLTSVRSRSPVFSIHIEERHPENGQLQGPDWQPRMPVASPWNFDPSRAFCDKRVADYRVWVRNVGSTEPVEAFIQDYTDLCAFYFGQCPRDRFLVLALGERLEDGREGWRLSLRPGEVFEIEDRFLSDSLRELVEQTVARIASWAPGFGGEGLLVGVRPRLLQGELLLTEVGPDEGLEPLEPIENLRLPVDVRNPAWRYAFKGYALDQEGPRALGEEAEDDPPDPIWEATWHPEKNGWFVSPDPITGYPKQVEVKGLHPPKDRSREQHLEFEVQSWQDCTSLRAFLARSRPLPELHGEAIQTRSLHAKDMNRFLEHLGYLKRESIVSVQGHRRRHNRGFVDWFTPENLRITVELESLQASWIDGDVELPRFGHKQVLLTHVYWNDLPGEAPEIVSDHLDRMSPGTTVEGYLTKIPRFDYRRRRTPEAVPSECIVYWRNGQMWQRERIQILNLARLPVLEPGSRLTVFLSADTGREIRLKRPYLRGRALWTLEDVGEDPLIDSLLSVPWEDHMRWVGTEEKWGRLVLFPQGWQPNSQTKKYIPKSEIRVGLSENRHQRGGGSHSVRRLVTGSIDGEERLLWGEAPAHLPPGKSLLREIRYQLDIPPGPGKSGCLLNRTLVLAQEGLRRPIRKVVKSSPGLSWESWLAAYLAKRPEPVAGFFRRSPHEGGPTTEQTGARRTRRFILDGARHRVRQAPALPVHPQGRPYLPFISYPETAEGVLLGPANDVSVSFRHHTLDRTLQRYREEIGAITSTRLVSLLDHELHLYYVGSEPQVPDRSDGQDRENEIRHRFEMGYGQTLLIPQSRLLWYGKPWEPTNLELFSGDRISFMEFIGLDEEGADKLALSIQGIIKSQGHRVYRQAKDYNIIHLVQLEATPRSVDLKSVHGLSERGWENVLKKYDSLTGRLRDEDVQLLQQRATEMLESGEVRVRSGDSAQSVPMLIYGRLDTDDYVREGGRVLTFRHMRLTWEDAGRDLLDGDKKEVRLFFQAGEILLSKDKNDCFLALNPPDRLHENDRGADFSRKDSLRLSRRNFSSRQELLKEVFENPEYGPTALAGQMLLITLSPNPKDPDRLPRPEFRGNTPFRNPGVVRTLLDREEGQFYAVVEQAEKDRMIVELRPGVRVQIEGKDYDFPEERVLSGTVVQISERIQDGNSQGSVPAPRYSVRRAAFSDWRYVPPQEDRPVVVLPLGTWIYNSSNPAAAKRPAFWTQASRFSTGALPQVMPQVRRPPDNGKAEEMAEQMFRLAHTPHPKIARIRKQGTFATMVPTPVGDPASRPPHTPRWEAGKFFWDRETGEVSFRCFSKSERFPAFESLDWLSLSFGDQNEKDILDRIRNCRWKYHDNTSSHWGRSNTVTTFELQEVSGIRGPILFELTDRPPRFRYSPHELKSRGYSLESLIQALRLKSRPAHDPGENRRPSASLILPVAGFHDQGLWLELYPGHVVEVPTGLCYWKSQNRRIPLNGFTWERMAPGDLVEVDLEATTDPYSLDKLLLYWHPGCRHAFGESPALLPRIPEDREGEDRFGVGAFTLTLPTGKNLSRPPLATLTPANDLVPFDAGQRLEKGYVVLVGVDENGQLMVHGLPGVTVSIDRDVTVDDMERDPLKQAVYYLDAQERIKWKKELPELIELVGGALPLTVENHVQRDRHLFLSRRVQTRHPILGSGQKTRARYLGFSGTLDAVVLKSGAELLLMPADRLIRGFAPRLLGLFRRNAETLREDLAATDLWLCRDSQGEIHVGLDQTSDTYFKSRVVSVFSHGSDSDQPRGLVVRSQVTTALHWMDMDHAAWAELSFKQARALFLGQASHLAGTLSVALLDDGRVSALQHPRVRREFDGLNIGSRLLAYMILLGEGERQEGCFYWSTEAGMVMEAHRQQPDASETTLKGQVRVGVVELTEGSIQRVRVAAEKHYPYFLNLPSWLLGADPDQAVRQYARKWYPDTVPDPQWEFHAQPVVNNARLLQTLAWYADRVGDKEVTLEPGCRAAVALMKRASEEEVLPLRPVLQAVMILNTAGWNPARIKQWGNGDVTEKEYQKVFKEDAGNLFRIIHRRALNSLHVELLMPCFSEEPDQRETHGLWKRFWKIIDDLSGLKSAWLSRELYDSILGFREMISISWPVEQSHLFDLCNALFGAMGRPLDPDRLFKNARVMQELISLTRVLPPGPQPRASLSPQTTERLRDLLNRLEGEPFDHLLMPQLPLGDRHVMSNPT